MKIINNESTVFFDIDNTLVMWKMSKTGVSASVKVTCPYHGDIYELKKHLGHIKILKDRKARGSFIVVWSAAGFAWAEAVIKALNLELYVDLIMTKPHAYVDDKQAAEFMGERIYLEIDDSYGQ